MERWLILAVLAWAGWEVVGALAVCLPAFLRVQATLTTLAVALGGG